MNFRIALFSFSIIIFLHSLLDLFLLSFQYGHRAVNFSETFGRKEVASYLKEVMEGNETDVKPEKETEDSEDT